MYITMACLPLAAYFSEYSAIPPLLSEMWLSDTFLQKVAVTFI